MPIEFDPDVIDTHAPVLYTLAEQLQQEVEAALFATSAVEQLLHVAGIQALILALMCEVASLMTAGRPTVNDWWQWSLERAQTSETSGCAF